MRLRTAFALTWTVLSSYAVSSCAMLMGPIDIPVSVSGLLDAAHEGCTGAATVDNSEPYWRPISGTFRIDTVANPGTTVHVRMRCAGDLIFDRTYEPHNRIEVGPFEDDQAEL